MNLSSVFEMLHSKIKFNRFVESLKEPLLHETKLINNNIEVEKASNNEKFNLLILTRLYEKGVAYLQTLSNKFQRGEDYIDLKELKDNLELCNTDLQKFFPTFKDIIKQYFLVDNDAVNIESIFSFFNKNKFQHKIKIIKYIEIIMNKITIMFSFFEKEINLLYDEADFALRGVIYIKEFESLVAKMLEKNEVGWKLLEYFK